MNSLLINLFENKLLIVSGGFAFSCGSLMMAQAEDTIRLVMGLCRSGPPDHGTRLNRGYLRVDSATAANLADGDSYLTPTAPI